MPRMGITREEVFAAAYALVDASQRPSLNKVRKQLGDRGSKETIQRYMSEWWAENPEAGKEMAFSEQLPDEVLVAFKRAYHLISTHVEQHSTSEHIQALELENEQLHQDLEDYHRIRASYTQLLSDRTLWLERYEQAVRDNERLAKFAPLVDQLEVITGERDQLKDEVDTLQGELAQQEASRNLLEKQAKADQVNLKAAQQRANDMADNLTEVTSQLQKLNQEVTQLANRNLELVDRNQALEQALAEKLAEAEILQSELRKKMEKPPTKPSAKPAARRAKKSSVQADES